MNSIEELERIDNYQYLSDREKQSIVNHFKTETLLMFNSFNGQKPQEIEQTVCEYVKSIINAERIEAQIIDIAITGSRCRGLEHEGSDLDVVIEYSGNIREDDFFNLLHSNEFKIENIPVDINPITKDKTGDMGLYLLKAEAYLKELAEEAVAKESAEESVSNNLQKPELNQNVDHVPKLMHKSERVHEGEQPEPEYIISSRERQQQEIATIKERNVVLNLSDADCDRLARKAGEAGISIGELLEGFIGDLVGGTYSHGSDEEYLAKQWFDRCGFREFQEETLLNNLIVMGYDVDTFLDVCDNIKQCEADIIKSKEHPEEYDPEEITYLEDDLEYYRDEFNDYIEDFRSGHKAADMDKEIEICRKWRDDFASLKVPELQPEYKR